jgi:hypothetical protein
VGRGSRKPEEPRFDGVLMGSRAIGLPAVRVLSDEYRDTPEPEDSERVPPPEPPGLVRRLLARLRRPGDGEDAPGG